MSSIAFLPTNAPTAILFSMGMPKSIGTILVDAMPQEGHHSANVVTEYPVEDGSVIHDNVIEQPDDLTITGVCGPASLLNPISSISRVLDVDAALYKLKHDRLPVSVVTGLRYYQNMIIIDYRVDRNKDIGAALVFTIQLKSVVIIQSAQTTVPGVGGSLTAQYQSQPTVNNGSAQGTPADPTDPASFSVNDLMNQYKSGLAAGQSQSGFTP